MSYLYKLALLIGLSLCCKVLAAQDMQAMLVGDGAKDTLIEKYLSNTKNATGKIRDLILQADEVKEDGDKIGKIKRYQIALTLVPYSLDSPEVVSILYAHFGTELYEAGAFELAVQYIHTSLDYQRKVSPRSSPRAYNLLGKIGSYYLNHQQYDSARYYYDLTILEARGTQIPLWIASAYNNRGILFFRTGKLAQAQESFNMAKAELVIKVLEDSTLDRSINDNLALLAIAQGDYARAEKFYKYNLEHYETRNSALDKFKAESGLANVYLKQKKMPAVRAQLALLKAHLDAKEEGMRIELAIRYHELLKGLCEMQNNWKEAAAEQANISALKDSINTNNSRQLNGLLQALTYSQVYQFRKDIQMHELKLAQQRKDLKTVQLIAVLVVVLGIGIFTLLFLYYREKGREQKAKIAIHIKDRQLAEVNLKYQQLEQEKLARELDYKKKDISDLALYLSKLKDVNDTMLDRLEELKEKKPEEQKVAIRSMTSVLGTLIHSHEKINMIQENIELVNKEFSIKLMNQYPDLTKSEIELCGFFRMNMSNKEIGMLKNISPQSVKMARYRLRKKFSLGSEVDIYKFLSNY